MKLTSRFWPLLVFTFVGYQIKAVNSANYTLITPTFKKVDNGNMTLGDLVCPAGFNFFDSVQTLKADGSTLDEYVYLGDGWYTMDQQDANNVVIPEGASILFNSQGTTEVQFSGEVNKAETSINCGTENYTAVGNTTPVAWKLSDIVFENVGFFDSVQTLQASGATDDEYVWLGDGWYTTEQEPAGDVLIQPGEGFLFNASSGSGDVVTVKFPSALSSGL